MADMRYVKLGGSGLTVSRVCLGGMGFGVPTAPRPWTVGYDETRAVIAAATDAGINFIDTANCYADGTSEEFIGQALRELGIPRNRVVLASKVFYNEGGLSWATLPARLTWSSRRMSAPTSRSRTCRTRSWAFARTSWPTCCRAR